MKRVFLLGGYDLEMLTIKDVLSSINAVFFDKNLNWNNAVLSAYTKELECYANQDCQIIGIELREDVQKPDNYLLIDHHNEYADRTSSLEQIALLLNYQLNRWQQLVAINDRNYIDGMRSFGATDEEINKIRMADRAAQGISQEEELKAELSILEKKTCKDIVIVSTECEHFSPITDRMYPCSKLLVYNSDSLVYYGKNCDKLVRNYHVQIETGDMYYGGGENGFLGFNKGSLSKNELEQQVEQIIKIVGE